MAGFENRVAIVTGGGSGIGAAVARTLAARGASVVVTDIDEGAAQTVAAEIESSGGVASAVRQDTTVAEDSRRVVEHAVSTYGGLHLAVNNAGIGGVPAPIGELDLANWAKVIDVNLNGVLYGLRYQIPAIEAAGGGSIVNMSSILGTNGTANQAAYVASKHAVVGLTKAAALEYAAKGIRVNAVGPGYIETPLLTKNLDQAAMDGLVALHPIGRLGVADEVANLVAFLLSSEASFVTGSYHLVDGGYAAQ